MPGREATTIVCDASPLIFLAKLGHLDLIRRVLGERVFVLRCVADELLSGKIDPAESIRLADFLASAEVIDSGPPGESAGALSRCDRATLTWAIDNKADWLLADERLLRRVAFARGLAVMGFLGLLLRAGHQGILSPAATRHAVAHAVPATALRISIHS